jgi:hypothetical protein
MDSDKSKFDFNKLFGNAKGEPVVHNGKILLLSDKIPAKFNETFTVTIEATSSKYPQGVGISEGVEVFERRVKRAVIWEYYSVPPAERGQLRSRLPFSFDVVCRNKSGHLRFYNMAEVDGAQSWSIYACAMIAEDIPNGRRYYCNDWQPNDDFNDVVFRVEHKVV